jgi:hypothetical protein
MHGTYFVTGNHEYDTGDLSNWLDALRAWNRSARRGSRRRVER